MHQKKCKVTISNKIKKLNLEINEICRNFGKEVNEITILAASKSQSIEKIEEAFNGGIRNFGENYLQEAEPKIDSLNKEVIWHFIGAIQTRKAKRIAEIFDWVHTVDSLKLAKKLNDSRPESQEPLKVCVQLNIDEEDSKAGIKVHELETFLSEVSSLKNLDVKGLMVIPKPRNSLEEQHSIFKEIKEIFDSLNQKGINMDTLSMGMSSDYGPAIKEGSTIVRIGTGIFGLRK
jgi:pyridoxal phosphate enzyme (YggS family)|tara:strand:+ start:246 stop:944 length:699 start_codon:yes stop_codon:yes gene_type:complete